MLRRKFTWQPKELAWSKDRRSRYCWFRPKWHEVNVTTIDRNDFHLISNRRVEATFGKRPHVFLVEPEFSARTGEL